MFCPKCKAEYREGFTTCMDCDVELVEAMPEEPEPVQLPNPQPDISTIVVFETFDIALLHIAKSILDDAGIKHFEIGAYDLDNITRTGLSYLFPSGAVKPFQIRVREDEAEVAAELLKEIAENKEI